MARSKYIANLGSKQGGKAVVEKSHPGNNGHNNKPEPEEHVNLKAECVKLVVFDEVVDKQLFERALVFVKDRAVQIHNQHFHTTSLPGSPKVP